MVIKDIQHIQTGETRTDGRYPVRIGSTVQPVYEPEVGYVMLLEYISDNEGTPKEGYLRTSLVTAIIEDEEQLVVETTNSRYILTKASKEEL